jgi:hypothetical protein
MVQRSGANGVGLRGGVLCIVSAAIKRQYIRKNKLIH